MNERCVAVSTVTDTWIRGCFSKPRYDFSDYEHRWQRFLTTLSKLRRKRDLILPKSTAFSAACLGGRLREKS